VIPFFLSFICGARVEPSSLILPTLLTCCTSLWWQILMTVGQSLGSRTGMDDTKNWVFLTLPGLEILPLRRPASSQSLYWLSYGGSYYVPTETNSVVFSPQANYIDWSTATGRRILVSIFVDRGVSRGQRGGSLTSVNLSFLDRSRYFFFKVVPRLSSRRWVDPVPDLLLLRKSGSAENRTRDLCVWPRGHRVPTNLHIFINYLISATVHTHLICKIQNT
jgi:hypothetical protein